MIRHKPNESPDFDRLNDRIIMGTPDTPIPAIRTSLDDREDQADNPYLQEEKAADAEKMKTFFHPDGQPAP